MSHMNLAPYFQYPLDLPGLLRLVNSLIQAKSPTNNTSIPSVDDAFYDGTSIQVIAKTDQLPQSAIVSGPGATLFLLTGLEAGLGHVLNLESGWIGSKDIRDSWDCNSGLFAAAMQVLASVPVSAPIAGNDVIVCGHSYGGAIGEIIAAWIQTHGLAGRTACYSFGSPRPGGPMLARQLASMPNTRIFTYQDPVPHIPPHADECPTITAILGSSVWSKMDRQVQPPTGYLLSTIGTLNPATNNPPLSGFTYSLANYITNSITGEGSGFHALSFYAGLLQIGIAANLAIPTIRPRQAAEEPLVLTAPEKRKIENIAIQQIDQDATNPAGITRNYVVPTVQSSSAPRYRAKRIGHVWAIYLGEELVAVGTGKRNAKKIARQFNKSARVLLNV